MMTAGDEFWSCSHSTVTVTGIGCCTAVSMGRLASPTALAA
jgi:hypothetical protein